MNDYCLFVELALQQCTKNDYADKEKREKHNVAAKKLEQLKAKMRTYDCEDILGKLLAHEDDRVKINAASMCMQMNVRSAEATHALQSIVAASEDAAMCFAAQMLLRQKSSPDQSY